MVKFDRLKTFARRLSVFNHRPEHVVEPEDGGVPANHADLAHYLENFDNSARAFRRFLGQCRLDQIKTHGEPAAVVVVPWVGTPVPWYSIALGIGLARQGRAVTFIWDDTPFPSASPFLAQQNEWIKDLLEPLRAVCQVVPLSSQQPQALLPADTASLERLLKLNMVWALRAGPPTDEELASGRVTLGHMRDTLSLIHGLLRQSQFRYLLVPGGVYGSSGLFLLAAGAAQVRAATFDSGLGWCALCPDGVTAQQQDIPGVFNRIYRDSPDTLPDIVALARAEFESRRQGRDAMAYQYTDSAQDTEIPSENVLIPLSVEFDSSALGRHHIFADSADWLVATIAYLLEHSQAPIVVRQHPSERREFERSRFDVGALLRERFGAHPRLHFIGATQPLNTYAVVERSRLVLPYVSTLGIEAAALGKTVLLSGNTYYSGLGFAHTADTRAEYFEKLGQALAGRLPALPDQATRAWVCFYINALCYRVFTNFSPQPPDFWNWVQRTPDDLYADPAIHDVLQAADEGVSLAWLRHQRRLAARDAA